MRPLRKLFEYVWPQWPLIIAAVSTAILVGLLQSLSIATISPLIKVMMDDQGIHGWIDSKVCKYRYGIIFEKGFSEETVQIVHVDPNGLGDFSGLRPQDTLIAVSRPADVTDPNASILQILATTKASHISLQFQRTNEQGRVEVQHCDLQTPFGDAVQKLPPVSFWSAQYRDRFFRNFRLWATDRLQAAISAIPRGHSNENTIKAILYVIVFSLVVTVIRCIAKFWQIYLSQKIMITADCRLREDLFRHVLNMPAGTFAQESPSDAVSRITRDTGEMTNMLRIVFGKALREPIIAFFSLSFAMMIQWKLTLIFMLGGPLIIGVVASLGKKMRKAARKSLEASAKMLGKLEETIAGIKVVKVFDRSEYEQNAFSAINRRLLKQHLRISRVDAATPPLLEILGLAAGCVALLVGVRSVTDSSIDNADFLLLLIFLGVAAESLRRSSDIWNYVQRANAAAGRIFEVLDHPLEEESPDCTVLPLLQKDIQFKNIVFHYESRPEPILKGMNLTIQAGENIALVGPNGSGKTTLANLVPRFYDPLEGQILIDGMDIRNVTFKSLRDQIGLVTQQSVTFNDTIARNIAYGKLDATHAEIIEAARQAHAHEFIEKLPKGYETVIGEHGSGLSGGQLQRIVIARAIIKDPAILIFDEATSQVDAESEAKIHDAIERFARNRTTIMIAHRFSTVVSADNIVVIDDGKIVAQGKHDVLIKTSKLYQALYETQLLQS